MITRHSQTVSVPSNLQALIPATHNDSQPPNAPVDPAYEIWPGIVSPTKESGRPRQYSPKHSVVKAANGCLRDTYPFRSFTNFEARIRVLRPA